MNTFGRGQLSWPQWSRSVPVWVVSTAILYIQPTCYRLQSLPALLFIGRAERDESFPDESCQTCSKTWLVQHWFDCNCWVSTQRQSLSHKILQIEILWPKTSSVGPEPINSTTSYNFILLYTTLYKNLCSLQKKVLLGFSYSLIQNRHQFTVYITHYINCRVHIS